QEGVEHPPSCSHAGRELGVQDIVVISDCKTEHGENERRHLDPEREVLDLRTKAIARDGGDGSMPELDTLLADKVALKQETRERRTRCQNRKRSQHDHGRFMDFGERGSVMFAMLIRLAVHVGLDVQVMLTAIAPVKRHEKLTPGV